MEILAGLLNNDSARNDSGKQNEQIAGVQAAGKIQLRVRIRRIERCNCFAGLSRTGCYDCRKGR
jgi:hypothetical protein